VKLHQTGKLDKAQKIYERILKADARSVNALHFYGLLQFQRGVTKRGIELVRNAITLDPEYADAHKSRCYDALHCAELVAHMRRTRRRFDAIVSADTFCYFGSLAAVFSAVKERLGVGGIFVFSVEKMTSTSADLFELQSHGRYAHSIEYIRQTLDQNGLDLKSSKTEVLRKELGEDVPGWLVIAGHAG
jgi:predicted TPR repeat methyltransferase